MDRDLFRLDLDKLQFTDIERFTGINRPEPERPKEGVRLDFKGEIPDRLGDIVTAFANTYGGLVILGVKSEKRKQNIPIGLPGIKGDPDIKTTIVNKILSSVYPRPSFSIGVAQHNTNPENVVVVIRVDESRIGPHMFIANQKNKIAIRLEDSTRYASLQEIEALFEKRQLVTSQDALLQLLADLYVLDGSDSRSGNYHKISLVPLDDFGILLDRNSEYHFEDVIKSIFKFSVNNAINVSHRHAKYYQIEARNNESYFHRIWRLYAIGAVEFISQIGQKSDGTQRKENLGDMIVDTISIVNAYKTLINEEGYFGRSYLCHEISIVKNTELATKMPPPSYLGDYDSMNGINLGRASVDSNTQQNRHSIARYLDYSDVEASDELIAENFLEHLRMIFHGQVDFRKLLEHVQWIRKHVVRQTLLSQKHVTGR